MKLLRVGAAGAEKPAMLDGAGKLRDLSGTIADFTADVLSDAGLARLRALDPDSLPVVSGTPRIGPCVPRPINYVCIGLNYADHAAETGGKPPKEPIIFLKSLGAFQGPNDDVVRPRGSTKLDWEVELGVVIGKSAKYITESQVFDHIAGYCVCNDVSEREYQIERSGTWDKGKGCDTFGPTGPWLVTRDEVPDPQQLKLWLDIDGTRRQDGTTANMIFNVVQLVSYVSHFLTLHPGDIIATGTPAGVGLGHKPTPVFLEPGQVMVAGVEGMGEQRSKVVQG